VDQKIRHETLALNFTKILTENADRSHVSFTTVTIKLKARMPVVTAFFGYCNYRTRGPNAGSSCVSSTAATIELELEFPTESDSENILKIG